MDHFDLCIVGAGVVGIAIAEAFSRRDGKDNAIVLLEKNERAGQEISSRNSEVIHAGLYYPPGSLKARLCREGNALLYAFCVRHGIAYRRLGKLIVAQEDELQALEALAENAQKNGVHNLSWLDAAALREREPALRAEAALLSPDTGIVDSHGLMESLLKHAIDRGVTYAPRTRMLQAQPLAEGFEVHTRTGSSEQSYRFCCRRLILAAGLEATALAHQVEGLPSTLIPTLRLLKGNYFRLVGRSPFRHLVYPLPERQRQGLGIHATLDLEGNTRFGPDVEELVQVNYGVNPDRRAHFAASIRQYYPGLNAERLQPDYAGIRPRLKTADGKAGDFLLMDSSHHGLPGLVTLFGIESPGLTASLALAEMLADCPDLMR